MNIGSRVTKFTTLFCFFIGIKQGTVLQSYFANDKTILHVVYQNAFSSKYHFVTLEFLGFSMQVEWGINLSSWPFFVKISQENVSLGYVYLLSF